MYDIKDNENDVQRIEVAKPFSFSQNKILKNFSVLSYLYTYTSSLSKERN